MNPSKVVVSAVGVREGFLYSLLTRGEQDEDPLITAASELARLRSRSSRHAHELVDWTRKAFELFGVDETEDEARYRAAACLLADIGWRAHPEYRGTQSLNIIAHASFIGVDHPGRAYLALTALYRNEGPFNEDAVGASLRSLATPRYLERSRFLAALLRVVYMLTAAMPGVIPRLRWEQRGERLALLLPHDLAGMFGERPIGRLAQLARISGRKLELAVEDGEAAPAK
jgi:exopolyphosphatase/guanosine-5'-triphosphate,3'-diphosphate pyrophosphatase